MIEFLSSILIFISLLTTLISSWVYIKHENLSTLLLVINSLKSTIMFGTMFVLRLTNNSLMKKVEIIAIRLYMLFSLYLFVFLYRENNDLKWYVLYLLLDSVYFTCYQVINFRNDDYVLMN